MPGESSFTLAFLLLLLHAHYSLPKVVWDAKTFVVLQQQRVGMPFLYLHQL